MSKKATNKEVCNIALGTVIEGDMAVEAHMRLEGKVHGNISCNGRVVMSAAAVVEGDIKCQDLVIEGKLIGNATAENQVHLLAAAEVKGNLSCKQIHIDVGAIFNGQCTTTLSRQG